MKQLKIDNRITLRDSYSISSYLKEISKFPLLDAKEEVELAQKIRTGDQRAINQLIRGNLRFVVSVAKQYQNHGLSLNDLINEGNIGLIKAATKFDETKGFKFISYAVWWIRQSILQALTQQVDIVKVPMNKVVDQGKLLTATNDFLQKNERKPTVEELADIMEISVNEVNSIKRSVCKFVSTDQPIGDDHGSTMIDFLTNNSVPNPDSDLDKSSDSHYFNRILNILNEKELMIVKFYYGINELNQKYSFEEIADKMALTRERVRQIKNRALIKVQKASLTADLKNSLS